MAEVDKVAPQDPPKTLPPGCTLVALPYVSKLGFTGATVSSIVLSILAGGFKNCKFLFLGDHSHVGARNAACGDALKENFEWLFFIDSDMDFPVDTLPRLKACNADVACTDMWSRNIPSFRTVMRLSAKDENGKSLSVPYEGHGIEEVDLCGMACTLIRTDLLRKMRDAYKDQPWFWTGLHGEDATFCFNAKDIGATIKCDYGITAGHWGVARMAGQDWSRDAANQPHSVANVEMMKRMNVKNLKEGE